jgi:hypothetical protein
MLCAVVDVGWSQDVGSNKQYQLDTHFTFHFIEVHSLDMFRALYQVGIAYYEITCNIFFEKLIVVKLVKKFLILGNPNILHILTISFHVLVTFRNSGHAARP